MVSAGWATLIEGGDIYTPAPLVTRSLLVGGGSIVALGSVERDQVAVFDPACQILDARDCIVMPALLDPHEHIRTIACACRNNGKQVSGVKGGVTMVATPPCERKTP